MTAQLTIERPPTSRRLDVALDALALLLAKATFIGLRLLTLYLCAASVGRATFGPLALAFTTAEICRYLGDWGTDTWSLRQFSSPEVRKARAFYAWVRRLRLGSSLIAFGSAWAAIHWLAPQQPAALEWLISVTAVTSLWLNFGVNWLQARALLRPCALWLAALGALCAAILLVGHVQHATLLQQISTLLAFEIVMAVSVVALSSRRPLEDSNGTKIDISEWARSATPIALAALLALGYGRLDQYFVSRTASADVLGDFSLAQRLVEPVLFVAAALSSTLYARASTLMQVQGFNARTRQTSWQWVRRVTTVAASTSAILGLLFWLAAPSLLPQYVGALPFVLVALACTVFRCTNLCLTAFIQAAGAYGRMFRISLINAVTITAGVLIAGTIAGPLGAALGVCLGEAINTCIQSYTLRELLAKENHS